MTRNLKLQTPSHHEFAWVPARGMGNLEPAPGRGYWQTAELPGDLPGPSLSEEQWRAKWKAQGDANRRRADRTASLIRELKTAPSPEHEREIIAELRADMGVQYVEDLVGALRAQNATKSTPNGGKPWR